MYPHSLVVEHALRDNPAVEFERVEFDVESFTGGDRSMEEAIEMPHERHRPHLREWFSWKRSD